MKKATEYGYGIRLLQQDLWETIVSFIISQNNNIPRIKGCIERLCDNFGEPVGSLSGREVHDIPSPETLAGLSVEDLSPVRLGYRAKYIADGGKLGRKIGSVKTKERKQEEYGKVIRSLRAGKSIRDTALICGVSVSTVQRVKKEFQL
jgi:N-glycosylase/DNA lyase